MRVSRASLKARWVALKRRIVREPLPPEVIAGGWALGMFIGCSVPFGLQLAISVPLAMVTRVSKVGATLGTFITNPLTIWFIYPIQCWVGSRVLREPLDWDYLAGEVFAKLAEVSLFSAEGWRTLASLGGRVLGSFFVGGLLLAFVMTPITYFFIKQLVRRYRARKSRRDDLARND